MVITYEINNKQIKDGFYQNVHKEHFSMALLDAVAKGFVVLSQCLKSLCSGVS